MARSLRDGWFKNSSRRHLRDVNRNFASDVAPHMLVLDAGAGAQPYRNLVDHARYESADFMQVDKAYAPPTFVCNLSAIPVEDGRYDRILFNQVFEHVPDPPAVLRELARVLKPGGRIICTCPLFYNEHETPYDYYRYTQFAHRHLFESVGLKIVRLDWLEGWFGTVAYMFETMAHYLPLSPRRLRGGGTVALLAWPLVVGTKAMAFLLAGIFYRLDLRFRLVGPGFPKNYVVIAEKPLAAGAQPTAGVSD